MVHLATEEASAPHGQATAEDALNAWRFDRDAVHFNGGSEFFGWGHRCVDKPRLLVIDKYFKKDRSTVRSYLIDGKTDCATAAEALAALAVPPELAEGQREKLATVTTEWMRPELRGPFLPLAEMGLIEWGRDIDNKVTCRLTPDGAAQKLMPDFSAAASPKVSR